MALNENAKKWVEALRSGEYEQCQDTLHVVGVGFCCLGVACDLYQKDVGDLEYHEESGIASYNNSVSDLPDKVIEWLGFRPNNSLGSYWNGPSLSGLNDNGRTFAEIADIIESEPEGLFVNQ